MKRRTSLDDGSLDLLLDAITNTFGGVLFLAVLIVVLLQFTGESNTTKSINNSKTELEIAELNERLATNKKLLKQFVGNQEVNLVNEIIQLKKQAVNLNSNLLKMNNELISNKKTARKLSLQIAEAQRNKSQLINEVQKVVEENTRTAKLPRLRATDKIEFPMIVWQDKVYFIYESIFNNSPTKFRTNDFIISDKDSGDDALMVLPLGKNLRTSVKPKPSSGLSIIDKDKLKIELRRELNNLDRNEHYLAIAIWENSFDTFSDLRKMVVDFGFEYRLMPFEEGEIVGTTTLKNIQVQ